MSLCACSARFTTSCRCTSSRSSASMLPPVPECHERGRRGRAAPPPQRGTGKATSARRSQQRRPRSIGFLRQCGAHAPELGACLALFRRQLHALLALALALALFAALSAFLQCAARGRSGRAAGQTPRSSQHAGASGGGKRTRPPGRVAWQAGPRAVVCDRAARPPGARTFGIVPCCRVRRPPACPSS